MIRTADEFRRIQLQIGGLAAAAAELKESVYPRNPQKYIRLLQPYLEDIRRLETLTSDYLRFQEVEEQLTDLRLRLMGPIASLGVAPAGLLSKTLEKFIRSVRSVFINFSRDLLVEPRMRREADKMCNFAVAAVFPGSLQVALNVPPDHGLFQNPQLFPKLQDSVRLLLGAAVWAERDDFEEILTAEVEDEVLRKVILFQVSSLIPKRNSGVEMIEFYGKMAPIGAIPRFSERIKERVKNLLDRPVAGEIEIATGSMREMDLDKHSFQLRERGGGVRSLRCTVPLDLWAETTRLLGKRVQVTGLIMARAIDGEVVAIEVGAIEEIEEA
jgi:hypothetical protein